VLADSACDTATVEVVRWLPFETPR